jgi:hypothetical protein
LFERGEASAILRCRPGRGFWALYLRRNPLGCLYRPLFRRFDRLAVENRSRGAGLPCHPLTQRICSFGPDRLSDAVMRARLRRLCGCGTAWRSRRRARWNLSPDHPVTAPAYSGRRSARAKELGLGRQPVPVAPPPTPTRGDSRVGHHETSQRPVRNRVIKKWSAA